MSTFPRSLCCWMLCTVAGLGLARAAGAQTVAQDQDTVQVVEVPLRGDRAITLPGVTHIVVVEDAICRAELTLGGIRFFGLLRGDTVVFAWMGETRATLLVRVEPPAPPAIRPSMSSDRLAQLGQGHASTNAQVAVSPDRRSTYFFQHAFGWSQQAESSRVGVRGQARHTSAPGVPLNVDSLSLEYARPGLAFTLLDFALNLGGGAEARVTPWSPLNSYMLRGASLALTGEAGGAELFAGTSIPSSYRSLRGTSHVAGVNLGYQLSRRLRWHSTTAGVSTPRRESGVNDAARRLSLFHTSGITYRVHDRWAGQLTGGAGTRGLYGDGALMLTGDRLSASTAVTTSSPEFSLNQLQVLSGGGTSVRANATWAGASRLAASLFYQHSTTRAAPGFVSFAGRADYLNPGVSVALTPAQALSLNGVYSRASGGVALGGRTLTRQLNLGWTAQVRSRFTNSLQLSAGASEDSRQGDTGVGLSVRNTLNVRVPGGFLNFGVQQQRQDPSLVARVRQEIGLLPPDLQELFLADPVAFILSDSLPADLRALFASLESTQSQLSVSGQFRVGRRLNLSASYSRLSNSLAPDRRTTTNVFGYTLAYQLAPALQLRSSLSDTYLLDVRRKDVVRATTFQLGLQVTFQGGPALLAASSRDRRIEGRVFVDRNVTGTADDAEPGLAGIAVRLDDGRTAVTDAGGRFQFRGLKPGAYRLSLPLDQFSSPVRMTTATSVAVELFEAPQAAVNFGLVNFSRVWGTVFNDYALEGARRADAPGLDKVALVVTGADGGTRRVLTDGSGDYRIDDLAPGSYRLALDPATLPPDYLHIATATRFDVKPVQTMVVDVPVRALRSVAGHVYVQGPSGLQTVGGVTVVAGRSEATTDGNGYFILRDLPAGDLTVTLKPDRVLPPGLAAPTGAIRLPTDPIAVDGATIVIRNPALLDYLVPGGSGRGR